MLQDRFSRFLEKLSHEFLHFFFVGYINQTESSPLRQAVASGILLSALSAAGLEVSNCAAECTGLADRDDMSKCREACEVANFQSQDPAVAACIQFFYFAVIPSCQLFACALTYIFPICGQRLELIYQKQGEIYQKASALSTPVVENLDEPVPKEDVPVPI